MGRWSIYRSCHSFSKLLVLFYRTMIALLYKGKMYISWQHAHFGWASIWQKKIKIINELVIWLILFPPRGSILCSYHCRVYGPIQSSLPLLKSLWYWPLSHTSGDGISTMTQMKGRKRKRKDKIERTFLSQSFFLKLYFAKLLSYWSSLIW